eukprot:TRINITY_DN402_c0_g1_i2.p1 TRINITY_DN402_c0_g1~~TRINITY_DN402_c0_g1_i2.p1  ORF type:complete len:132 (+),score=19.66 TRINITY_DN402_c0_g1_i2:54-449(+)
MEEPQTWHLPEITENDVEMLIPLMSTISAETFLEQQIERLRSDIAAEQSKQTFCEARINELTLATRIDHHSDSYASPAEPKPAAIAAREHAKYKRDMNAKVLEPFKLDLFIPLPEPVSESVVRVLSQSQSQ